MMNLQKTAKQKKIFWSRDEKSEMLRNNQFVNFEKNIKKIFQLLGEKVNFHLSVVRLHHNLYLFFDCSDLG
jgi:hypothetical protein